MKVRFDELVAGAELPEMSRVVTREDVKAYADASGDHNPLHQDDSFARGVGFDGIIAHGMFTMGHLARYLSDLLGDPSMIERLKVSFRSAVSMGDEIVAGGRVKEIDRDAGTASIDLWVSVNRDDHVEYPIRRAEARVRFPGPAG